MMSTDPWFDFEQIRHNIKNNTVDRLKQILTGLNEECYTHISKSGKKQDIIDRIVSVLDSWRANNSEDKWLKAKSVVYQVRANGIYMPGRSSSTSTHNLPPRPSTMPHTAFPAMNLPPKPYQANPPGASNLERYDPYAPPRKPTNVVPQAPRPPDIQFKESPFFTVEQAISSIVECPESASATDRRQAQLSFTLTNDHIEKLTSPGTRYQLRLFCTSSIFYSGANTFRATSLPCPIEFPPTCEVRVNSNQITASLKGLKKKPGTAPPPDLSKYLRFSPSPAQNRVEMVYVNSQQPVQSKKYYLVVMLVTSTTVERLVEDLKANSFMASEVIRQKMLDTLTEDDDIVAGPQKMSLKCPLSYMRVGTPCRSSKCVHAQCFDATSWFAMMEQTTTWLCPVCERVLDWKDLIIDGYFNDILKHTPESVEDVMVEADGEWHTSDNKYGSDTWLAQHPSAPPAEISSSPPRPLPVKTEPTQADGLGFGNEAEVLVLDSEDEEDEGRVKQELSPRRNSPHAAVVPPPKPLPAPQASSNVIDLTIDSDDEAPPPPPRPSKRKTYDEPPSSSPTEAIWKKGRLDTDRTSLATTRSGPVHIIQHSGSTSRGPSATYNTQYSESLPSLSAMGLTRGGTLPSRPQPGSSTYMPRPPDAGSGWRS